MDSISLWQPWAQWVALGWKTVETRDHDRFVGLVGKRVAIHAAQRWDATAFWKAKLAGRPVSGLDLMKTIALRIRHGAVLCTVDWLNYAAPDYVKVDDDRIPTWKRRAMYLVEGKHLYFMDLVQRVMPVVMKGGRGIFDVPDELLQPWRDER